MGIADEAAKQIQKHVDAVNALKSRIDAVTPKIPSYMMPGGLRPFEMPAPPDGHLASGFYKRLREWISEFESELDEQTEVGVRLVSFGQALIFHLAEISYWNPQLIRFDGFDPQGQPVQLIQHVSQISVLLMKVPKLGDTPRRIGFHTHGATAPGEHGSPS